MVAAIPLTWLQLKREKTRLAMAVLGVGFAVVLVFMQLGFRDALFEGSVRYHNSFHYDLAMISPKTDFIVRTEGFSRRRLYQALGADGVIAQILTVRDLGVPGFTIFNYNSSMAQQRLPDLAKGITEPSESGQSILRTY